MHRQGFWQETISVQVKIYLHINRMQKLRYRHSLKNDMNCEMN